MTKYVTRSVVPQLAGRHRVGRVGHGHRQVGRRVQCLDLDERDRLAVAEAIWDSVARDAAAGPLSAPQRKELERRLADSIARPEAVTPWEVVKARALARARQ